MRVVIAGGHGKIALRLIPLLVERGDQVVGIIRNPAHGAELQALGAEPAVLDLENSDGDALAEVLHGADVAVFAAGAGPGSGAARKTTVDLGAAVLLAETAERVGVRRHVQISAMGLDRADQPGMDEVFAVYLRAKDAAEQDLRERDLDWTILRPGQLTDEAGTGLIALSGRSEYTTITREDVAGVVAALLDTPASIGRTLELVQGATPIQAAVAALSDG
ncbi:putative NAD(P)-binding protein [Tamaricihabitans halophyticus]|uniref:Putative NAD(P)-binding protein n=1 Tax=Tamaricihabitans halophyticus TaxID=1262583 RepID=A0A4R2R3I0_9PSEU|nr:SDR family oxidoreductase [Tamaricihabitans halophyticus]TCP54071.1 putative NAD(P)-binding protein [Tamaricihabitans halophyticus]